MATAKKYLYRNYNLISCISLLVILIGHFIFADVACCHVDFHHKISLDTSHTTGNEEARYCNPLLQYAGQLQRSTCCWLLQNGPQMTLLELTYFDATFTRWFLQKLPTRMREKELYHMIWLHDYNYSFPITLISFLSVDFVTVCCHIDFRHRISLVLKQQGTVQSGSRNIMPLLYSCNDPLAVDISGFDEMILVYDIKPIIMWCLG